MDLEFEKYLSELKNRPISFGATPGSGGAENLCMVEIPTDRHDIGEIQLIEFLRAVQQIWLAQLSRQTISPVTFYVWHDAQANQIRFSLARGTVQNLPFGARIEQVSELSEIVREYLTSESRDGILLETLQEVLFEEPDEEEQVFVVRVWAIILA